MRVLGLIYGRVSDRVKNTLCFSTSSKQEVIFLLKFVFVSVLKLYPKYLCLLSGFETGVFPRQSMLPDVVCLT